MYPSCADTLGEFSSQNLCAEEPESIPQTLIFYEYNTHEHSWKI